MTTIKINIFDNILTQVTKKNTQVAKKKRGTSLEEVTRHEFLPGGKKIKYVHQTEKASQDLL